MPHSGIKNRLLSVAAEEQARRKNINKYIIICIIADLKENVKMFIKKCRKCGRKAIYRSLGLCYCVGCYSKIYGKRWD